MEARGLAIDLFCIMHDHDPYGHCPNSIPTLARLLREDPRKLRRLLDELLVHKVIKQSEDRPEFFYSSRMIRDEAIRAKRRSNGKLGGNPKLKVDPTSPEHLPNISPTSRQHLANISPTSPEDLENIFKTSPEHLADISITSQRTRSEEIRHDNELSENEVNHLDNALSKDRLTLEEESCTPPSSSSSSSSSKKRNKTIVEMPEESAFDLPALWKELCPDLPQVREITPKRRQKIRSRIKEHHSIDWWKDLFAMISGIPFLNGENKTGWRASFDWVIENPDNAIKVLEGKYASKEDHTVSSNSG